MSEYVCWICRQPKQQQTEERWIEPCGCIGTTRWVHEDCASSWVAEKRYIPTCPMCLSEFSFVSPPIPRIASFGITLGRFYSKVLLPYSLLGVGWAAYVLLTTHGLSFIAASTGSLHLVRRSKVRLLVGAPLIPISVLSATFDFCQALAFPILASFLCLDVESAGQKEVSLLSPTFLLSAFPLLQSIYKLARNWAVGKFIGSLEEAAPTAEPDPDDWLEAAYQRGISSLLQSFIGCCLGRVVGLRSRPCGAHRQLSFSLVGSFAFATAVDLWNIFLSYWKKRQVSELQIVSRSK